MPEALSAPRGPRPEARAMEATVKPSGILCRTTAQNTSRPSGTETRKAEAIYTRLDQLNAELRALNRRLDAGEHLAPIVNELGALNDSLQALAYAALGQRGPEVRRRRAG